ncbi:hypothetical protein F5B22DRAFT_636077 [Xylaria bambusicola]|uniref:uncharacterized protein n=1 Tax=Xylaria bambusicola TaxID=326684 RepID=UPI002007BE95|nr:uncharacterized protein F5B22DRAFT_636077 [Xylaria bambusicola]KAI0517156.1 hypothetical protein F5B22DRAFT_636077 [Xylaria bambusicola]
MRAWVYSKAGKSLASALTLSKTARRPPSPLPADKLLVRVTHMSPNPADHKVPEIGQLASLALTRSFTASPGMDYAGVVEEVGAKINNTTTSRNAVSYKPGDKVFGKVESTPFGTLGEYIQPFPNGCVPLPPSVSPASASTLGTAAQTAYQTLIPYITPGAGDEVFVNGGSGGVGTFAIQIAAKVLGCVVTTSCSSRNTSLCSSLGAATVLDYATTDIASALRARGQVFKLVVDCVGGSPADLYTAANDYLLPSGTFVQIGGDFSPSALCATASRAMWPGFLGGGKRAYKFLVMETRRDDLVQLAQWMAEGKIEAVIDGDVYPFEEAPKVFEKLQTKRTRGNLVVKVSD